MRPDLNVLSVQSTFSGRNQPLIQERCRPSSVQALNRTDPGYDYSTGAKEATGRRWTGGPGLVMERI